MLYHFSLLMRNYFSFFNVFHYISFRVMAGLLSTLLFAIIFGKWFIGKSQQLFPSKARPWTPEHHKLKDNKPTMGGLLILMSVMINVLLWANLARYDTWIFLLCLLSFGVIGFADDWKKIHAGQGMPARTKFFLQLGFSGLIVILWMILLSPQTIVSVPFLKNIYPDIGWLFIPWVMLVITGCSNAVNLTDGLDGLAIGSLISTFATFSIICYVAGHSFFAAYLNIPFAGSAELAVIGAILVGASLGFLWYNTYPAQIFMGDVGSLALGAALGLMALMCKQELLLLLVGGLFVVETISVIVQVLSYKLLGKRIFKMAPLHHHFELRGWQESKITIRFGIISLVLALLTLLTLKVR